MEQDVSADRRLASTDRSNYDASPGNAGKTEPLHELALDEDEEHDHRDHQDRQAGEDRTDRDRSDRRSEA